MRVNTALLIISFAGIFALCGSRVFAATYTIDPDGTGDYPTIQAAIDAAVSGDIIQVEDGTYTGDGNRDIDFLGKAITVRGNVVDPNLVVIDCQGTEAEPHRGFRFVSGEGDNSVLEGLKITNGYGPEEMAPEYLNSVGGAIFVNDGEPTIRNCVISGNSAYHYGGGVYGSSGVIENCKISGNSAVWSGGGLSTCHGTIINCTISGNYAGNGGGLSYCNATIAYCTIENNTAQVFGGGEYYCHGRIANCKIRNNHAGSGGGGLHSCNGVITSCTISGNSTGSWGGGLRACYGVIVNNIIWANTARVADQVYDISTPSYSCIQDWLGGGSGNIKLGPVFDADGIHLLADSPCINTGDPSYAYDPNEKDIDGQIRVLGRIDMGADEFLATDSAAMYVSQENLNFIVEGVSSEVIPQTLEIFNCGTHELNWQIENDCDWLIVTPLSGQTDFKQPSEIVITIDPNFAQYGIQSCQFQTVDPSALYSPQAVTIISEVLRPEMTISQNSFSFTSESMDNPPVSQVLTVQNTGYDTLNWTVTGASACEWLTAVPESGQTGSSGLTDVSLSVDPVLAGYGSHSCELTVSDPNADNSPQVVTMTLDVLRPEISVSPSPVNFECDVDEPNVLTQTLQISNIGYDTLNWSITENCNWLSVSPASGQSQVDPSDATVTVDTAGLEVGLHRCDLSITDDNASNSPLIVPVTLHVYRVGERHVPIEYPTIQEAIDAAINGDHVIVHPGRYFGNGNEFIDFEGKEIVLRSIDPTDPESVDQTILIPDFLPIFSFNGHDYHSSVIDGLTIAGEENGERYQHEGFGIAIDCYASNSPLVRNCVFRDLVGEAVVYGNHSTMRFENCRFIDNALWYSVLMSGGAGSMGEDSLSLKNCLIANNILFLDGQQFGSTCIYVYFASLQMDGCTLAHNFAKSYLDSRNNRTGFPGIFASDSPVSIKNSIVWGNEGIPENNLNRQIVFYRFGQPSELSEPWVSVSQSDIQYGEDQILLLPDPDSFETYMETRELPDPNLNDPNWIRWEIGNMDADPLFSREPDDGGDGWFPDLRGVGYSSFYNNIPGDYHLKSESGRFGFARADFNWDKQVDLVDFSMMAQWWNMSVYSYPEWHHLDMDGGNMVINEVELLAFLEDYLQPRVFGEWATDDVTSPCIDAGDASDIGWQSELWPHGGRVNMGAYGGTPQASLSLNTVGNPADLNHDDAVDLIDWSLWADDWMDERVLLDSDFDGSNIVDSNDLGIFLDNWLWAQ